MGIAIHTDAVQLANLYDNGRAGKQKSYNCKVNENSNQNIRDRIFTVQ